MMPTEPRKQKTERRRTFIAGLVLLVVTLALYWPATHHDFILLDDAAYVTDNPHVAPGLSLAAVKWAFTSAYASNWHPLTWLSHALDCSIFGLFAGGHHLTSVLIHVANTLLLFFLLKRITQSFWPAFLVAAWFGWHPLHVESVAWIAERKDVLSTFFMFLTLLAYARYVEKSRTPSAKAASWYALALVCFALGLLAKPMIVTLPFVLLLLDFWPLNRIAMGEAQVISSQPDEAGAVNRHSFTALIVEKIPFFALALAVCAATVVAQKSGGAVRSIADVPFGARLLNALIGYAHYAGKTVWPLHLSIFYLLPTAIPVAPAICAVLVIAAVSFLSWRWRFTSPWFVVGWLWFLGTLVPVIGLVQVGSQAMADRYSYVPVIGLFIMAVWAVNRWTERSLIIRIAGMTVAAASLLACLILTSMQLGYWRDSVSLFQHAVEVTSGNYFVEYELGVALANADRNADAIVHHTAALRLNPYYEPAQYHLALEFAAAGRLDEAAAHFSDALQRDPNSQQLHNNFGVVLARQNKLEAAVAQFNQAIQLDPNDASAYLNAALSFQRLGQAESAFTNFSRAQELEPASPQILSRFAFFLATCPEPRWHDPVQAVRLAANASDLTRRENPYWLATLATTSAVAGNFSNAIATAELAQTKSTKRHLIDLAKKLEENLVLYRKGQVPPLDWQHPEP